MIFTDREMNVVQIIRRICSKLKILSWESFSKNIKISIRNGDICGLRIRSNGSYSVRIGKGAECRTNILFNLSKDAKIEINENVIFNALCILNAKSRILIGKNCIIGQNVMMYDHDHDHDYHNMDTMRDNFLVGEIIIGENVWIGSNVIILRGTTIGDRCVIGAGTVLKDNLAANTMIYNSPPHIIKSLK
jgi:acetyltransferase-like isoleucine patch superfamily enzyme